MPRYKNVALYFLAMKCLLTLHSFKRFFFLGPGGATVVDFYIVSLNPSWTTLEKTGDSSR